MKTWTGIIITLVVCAMCSFIPPASADMNTGPHSAYICAAQTTTDGMTATIIDDAINVSPPATIAITLTSATNIIAEATPAQTNQGEFAATASQYTMTTTPANDDTGQATVSGHTECAATIMGNINAATVTQTICPTGMVVTTADQSFSANTRGHTDVANIGATWTAHVILPTTTTAAGLTNDVANTTVTIISPQFGVGAMAAQNISGHGASGTNTNTASHALG